MLIIITAWILSIFLSFHFFHYQAFRKIVIFIKNVYHSYLFTKKFFLYQETYEMEEIEKKKKKKKKEDPYPYMLKCVSVLLNNVNV